MHLCKAYGRSTDLWLCTRCSVYVFHDAVCMDTTMGAQHCVCGSLRHIVGMFVCGRMCTVVCWREISRLASLCSALHCGAATAIGNVYTFLHFTEDVSCRRCVCTPFQDI